MSDMTTTTSGDLSEYIAHVTEQQKAEWRELASAVSDVRERRDGWVNEAGFLLMCHQRHGTPLLETAQEAATEAAKLDVELEAARERLTANPYYQALTEYNAAKGSA